jgi:hypothetical protein
MRAVALFQQWVCRVANGEAAAHIAVTDEAGIKYGVHRTTKGWNPLHAAIAVRSKNYI